MAARWSRAGGGHVPHLTESRLGPSVTHARCRQPHTPNGGRAAIASRAREGVPDRFVAVSEPVKSPGQPPVFWITLVAGVVGLGILVGRMSSAGSQAAAIAIGLAIAIVIVGLVLAFFALSMRRRLGDLASAFPRAIIIPITVGHELADTSRRIAQALGDDRIALRPTSYAALAVDGDGLHVASDHPSGFGHITGDRVTVDGYGRSLLGARAMTSLRLRVSTDEGDIEFPFVPMRLRGNPTRQLTSAEYAELSANILRALSGEAVPSGWPH